MFTGLVLWVLTLGLIFLFAYAFVNSFKGLGVHTQKLFPPKEEMNSCQGLPRVHPESLGSSRCRRQEAAQQTSGGGTEQGEQTPLPGAFPSVRWASLHPDQIQAG